MPDNSALSSAILGRPDGFSVINCPHCSTVNPDFAESCSRCGTPMPLGESETIQMVDATVIAPGSDFGPRYRIDALLGQGGMGRVYKAYDKELDRTVAIKVVREGAIGQADALKRFKQELVLASKISHKNILRIHDMGDVGGLRFISMAFVEGQDLQHIIHDNPKMPLDRILNFARQIAEALAAAHAEGVVHRDLKPQNPGRSRPYQDLNRSKNTALSEALSGNKGCFPHISPESSRRCPYSRSPHLYRVPRL